MPFRLNQCRKQHQVTDPRTDARPDQTSPSGSQRVIIISAAATTRARTKRGNRLDGAVEYTYDFMKEDLRRKRERYLSSTIEHYVRRVVTYLGRLQSVTQCTDGGLSVQV